MYIYMSKRKPKLCRMKRLDVSQNSHFFFLLKMNQFILSPSLSTFLLTENNSLNICRFCFRESMKLGCKKESPYNVDSQYIILRWLSNFFTIEISAIHIVDINLYPILV